MLVVLNFWKIQSKIFVMDQEMLLGQDIELLIVTSLQLFCFLIWDQVRIVLGCKLVCFSSEILG